jgi:hypothetical protein
MAAKTGQPRQDSWDRKVGKGWSGQDILTDQPKGQPGQDREERLART